MITVLENVSKMLDSGVVDNQNMTLMISKQRPDVCGAPAIEPIRAKTSLCVYLFLHLFLSFPIQRYFPKCQPRYQVSLPLVFGNPLSLVPSLAPRNKVEENP